MCDLKLKEQIALFAMNYHTPPEGFDGGQIEWASVIIDQSEKFCKQHADKDWSADDWYLISDMWMDECLDGMEGA